MNFTKVIQVLGLAFAVIGAVTSFAIGNISAGAWASIAAINWISILLMQHRINILEEERSYGR